LLLEADLDLRISNDHPGGGVDQGERCADFVRLHSRCRYAAPEGDRGSIPSQTFEKPGSYTLLSPPLRGSTVTITIDKEFSTPGDHRRLRMILAAVGFQPLAHESRSP
jgi:hypothetical protein